MQISPDPKENETLPHENPANVQEKLRIIHLNDVARNHQVSSRDKFASNHISTSKYSFWRYPFDSFPFHQLIN